MFFPASCWHYRQSSGVGSLACSRQSCRLKPTRQSACKSARAKLSGFDAVVRQGLANQWIWLSRRVLPAQYFEGSAVPTVSQDHFDGQSPHAARRLD